QAKIRKCMQCARGTTTVHRDQIIMGEVDYDSGWPRKNDGVRSGINRPLDCLCQLGSLRGIKQLPGLLKKRSSRAELRTPAPVTNPIMRGVELLGTITPH